MLRETFLKQLQESDDPIKDIYDIKAGRNGARERYNVTMQITQFRQENSFLSRTLDTMITSAYSEKDWEYLAPKLMQQCLLTGLKTNTYGFLAIRFKGVTYTLDPTKYPVQFVDLKTCPVKYKAEIEYFESLHGEDPNSSPLLNYVTHLKRRMSAKMPMYVMQAIELYEIFRTECEDQDADNRKKLFKNLLVSTSEEDIAEILGQKTCEEEWRLVPAKNLERIREGLRNQDFCDAEDALLFAHIQLLSRTGVSFYTDSETALPVVLDGAGDLFYYNPNVEPTEPNRSNYASDLDDDIERLAVPIDHDFGFSSQHYFAFAERTVKEEPLIDSTTSSILNKLKTLRNEQ